MPTAYGQASHPPMCSLLLSKLRPLLSHSPPFFAAPFRRRRSLAFSALPTKTKAVDAALLKEKWLESLTLPSPEEHVVTRESSYVIGVDPDLSGALALLKINHVLASSEAQVSLPARIWFSLIKREFQSCELNKFIITKLIVFGFRSLILLTCRF